MSENPSGVPAAADNPAVSIAQVRELEAGFQISIILMLFG